MDRTNSCINVSSVSFSIGFPVELNYKKIKNSEVGIGH